MVNYTDVLTHCPDTKEFVKELREKKPKRLNDDDVNNPIFLARKAPGTKKNKNNKKETLAYIRADSEDLADFEELNSLVVLGTYEDVFSDPLKRDVYDRIYDQAPVEIDDGEGGVSTLTPPEKFVVIA